MSFRAKKNMSLLKLLSKAKPLAAKVTIKAADKELVDEV